MTAKSRVEFAPSTNGEVGGTTALKRKTAERPTGDNPQRRSALWLLSILLLSYVPGLEVTSIGGVEFSSSAKLIVQSLIIGAAAYYMMGLFLDRQIWRAANSEASIDGSLSEGVMSAIQRVRQVAASIESAVQSASITLQGGPGQYKEAISTIAHNLEPDRIGISNEVSDALTSTVAGRYDAEPENLRIAKSEMEALANLASERVEARINELRREFIQSAEHVHRDVSQQCAEAREIIAGASELTRELPPLEEQIRKLSRQLPHQSFWHSMKDDLWDYWALNALFSVASILWAWNTVVVHLPGFSQLPAYASWLFS